MDAHHYVEIVNYGTGEVVKRIDCGSSMKRAEKIDGGINVNLNHEEYYTRIVEKQET